MTNFIFFYSRMSGLQSVISESINEIDLAVGSAKRSQLDLSNRLDNLEEILRKLKPDNKSGPNDSNKKIQTAHKKILIIENAIKNIEKRVIKMESHVKP